MPEPEDRAGRSGSGAWSALAIHITVYVAVNLLLIACWVLFSGGSVNQLPTVLTSLDAARNQQFWPMYVMVFWGTALLIHLGVVVATAPGRRRRRKERRRQQRRRAAMQASVVGVLPDGMLTDAALAGIRLTDGDKAARQVQRDAARRGSGTKGNSSKGSGRKAGGTDRGVRKGSGSTPAASEDSGATGRDPTAADQRSGDRKASGRKAADPRGADRSSRRAEGTDPTGRDWVAVLFTDIVDSTSLNEALGDDAWASVLADHRALVRRAVADHDGREVGTQGDGFLLRFSVPDDAVRCAVAIQEQLARLRAGDDGPYVPAVRMGVHAGEAVHHDGDDLVGRVVNLAARVTDAANADEILLTEPVADHLGGDLVLVDRGLRQLKGFDRPRHLLAVVWQPAAEAIDLAEGPSRRTDA